MAAVTFTYLGGRRCLSFVGTLKRRTSEREELLTAPDLLSDWAVGAGMLDRDIKVRDEDLVAAIALREAIYRTVTAQLGGTRPKPADVALVNEVSAQPQLVPRLRRDGTIKRTGDVARLLASLAADTLDLLAGNDIGKVKRCAFPRCTRLYVDSSRAQNRHWCGMGTCGNKMNVRAFRERQRTS
jgi:predicted RNA-binding Zn ribbon-like protein